MCQSFPINLEHPDELSKVQLTFNKQISTIAKRRRLNEQTINYCCLDKRRWIIFINNWINLVLKINKFLNGSFYKSFNKLITNRFHNLDKINASLFFYIILLLINISTIGKFLEFIIFHLFIHFRFFYTHKFIYT